MALFKIHKGTEKNNDGTSKLPQSYIEGYAYFATDTGRFYIDTTNQASGRKMINPDAITNITRNGTTFTATKVDGSTITFTQQDNNTTYSAGTGISLSGTTFSLDVAETKTALGLGSNAYTSTAYLPLSGGTLSGPIYTSSAFTLTSGLIDQFTTAPLGGLFSNGVAFTNPTTRNDVGWIRILGTGESDTILEIATGDDGGGETAENIVVRQYNTSNTIAKEVYLLNASGNTVFPGSVTSGGGFIGNLDGTATYASFLGTAGNCLRAAENSNAAILFAYIHGLTDWAIERQSSDEQINVHFYDKTDGHWISEHILLDNSNCASYCLPLNGGTVTGTLTIDTGSSSGHLQLTEDAEGGTIRLISKSGTYCYEFDAYNDETIRVHTATKNPNGFYKSITWNGKTGVLQADAIYGAVWNDYAEYRSQNETIEPGYITYCDDDGKLKLTTERLQKFEGVVSDTFGFAIGETNDCKTPLAVSGRVLVYCDPEDKFHSGDCVCAGPDGLAYRMTREEIIEFPDRIVGIVSEIPTYETWGTGNIEVNGRIWVKVR